MNVLAIESSGPIGSVAVCRDGQLLAEGILEHGMEHGRMLVMLLDRVVRQAGWDKQRDIELLAVSQGPGSYTGLRVGIACAKTLAMLLGKPLVGVCSFDAMAENAPPDRRNILTVLDAKRGDVYAGAYERADGRARLLRAGGDMQDDVARTISPRSSGIDMPGERSRVDNPRHTPAPSSLAPEGRLRRILGPALMKPAATKDVAQRPVYVMGDALTKYRAEYPSSDFIAAPEAEWRIRAATVARLGLEAFKSGRSDEPVSMQPIYLRLAEAEEKRLAREKGKT